MRRPWPGPDGPEQDLPKGDVTEGVVRIGQTVRRPPPAGGGDAVIAYLDHLAAVGFEGAPRHLGRDRKGRDVLDFLVGDVAGDPLPAWAGTDHAMGGVARLQRRLHGASSSFSPPADLRFPRELDGAPRPTLPDAPRLVSHNDMTPQNVVFRDGDAWGLIDFDLAGRTTALTDLATTAMYWVPLVDPADRDPVMRDVDAGARLRAFLDAYGLATSSRVEFLDAAALRYAQSHASMRWRAEHLGGGWDRMWRAGVGGLIDRRAVWFDRERNRLLEGIC